MKALLNRHLLSLTAFDSGSLTQLTAVIHQFPQPGEYLGTVLQDGRPVANFRLGVRRKAPEMQLNLDLAALNRRTASADPCGQPTRCVVNVRGVVLFYVSRGAGDYAVVVWPVDQKEEAHPFDSRRLQENDCFAVTVIRPGTYRASEVDSGAEAKVVVAYPQAGGKVYGATEPMMVTFTGKGFEPEGIETQAGQALVFCCLGPARLRLELVEPDDGSGGYRDAENA